MTTRVQKRKIFFLQIWLRLLLTQYTVDGIIGCFYHQPIFNCVTNFYRLYEIINFGDDNPIFCSFDAKLSFLSHAVSTIFLDGMKLQRLSGKLQVSQMLRSLPLRSVS